MGKDKGIACALRKMEIDDLRRSTYRASEIMPIFELKENFKLNNIQQRKTRKSPQVAKKHQLKNH